MGTVTGSNPALITAYLNGVQIMQVSDTGNEGGEGTDCGAGRPVFTSGSPGIGFYDNRKSCTSMLQLVCSLSPLAVICPALWRLFFVSHGQSNGTTSASRTSLRTRSTHTTSLKAVFELTSFDPPDRRANNSNTFESLPR